MATREERIAAARKLYAAALDKCKAEPSDANWAKLREAGRALERADGSYKNVKRAEPNL